MAKLAIPTAPAELEEMLADRTQVDRLFAEGQFTDVVAQYARNVAGRDVDIARQVKEQVQAGLTDLLKSGGLGGKPVPVPIDYDPTRGPSLRYGKVANAKAVGAPLNGKFSDVGEFFQAAWRENNKRQGANPEAASKLQEIVAYQERIGSEGGFLVPEEFRAELLRLSLESAIVRPRARVVPMSTSTLRFPAIDETSHATSIFGGITVYRTEEGAELTESSAAFGSIKLDTTKQTALAHVTNELVNDAAGGFAMYITEMFPEAIAYFEDVDFLAGSGVGEPLGALSTANTALIAVSKKASQVAATIVWENVIGMYARCLPSSLARAVWLASPDTFVELATMAVTVGTGGSAVWITDATGTPVLTLLGRPVIMTEKAPGVLGTQGDLSLVDLGMYLIGDRQMMTIDSSPHVKFTSDKTTFRVISRNDGRPWLQSAITPRNGGPSLSPFVQLETRS